MSRVRDKDAAISKYEEFHRFAPRKVGDFAKSFAIPRYVYRGGAGLWVTYRSDKTDPATLKLPRGTIDYIHEHDTKGVTYYLAKQDDEHASEQCEVPERFRNVDALTLLGQNLGFCFVTDGGDQIEAVSTVPMPDLYTTPDGKCLLVIQGRREIVAMAWGGGLGVYPRGIDG